MGKRDQKSETSNVSVAGSEHIDEQAERVAVDEFPKDAKPRG